MYELRVMDCDFKLLGSLTYDSLQMERSWYEVGKLEVHLTGRPQFEIKPDQIVFIDPTRAYLIDNISIDESSNGGLKIVVSGSQLKSLVGRRVTVPDSRDDQQTYGFDRFPKPSDPKTNIETIIKYYVNKHAVKPVDVRRTIPRLTISPDKHSGAPTRISSRFEALDELFKTIGESYEIGYDITLDLKAKSFVFDVIAGVDHSYGTSKPVVFSTSFANIKEAKYTVDTKNYVNTAYLGGAGEAESRLIQTIFTDDNATGVSRRETWLDCGSIDMVEDLIYDGQHKLEGNTVIESLTADTISSGPFIFGADWDAGDIVTIQFTGLGLKRDARVVDVREVYEGGRIEVTATFGKREKTLLDEIRKMEVSR